MTRLYIAIDTEKQDNLFVCKDMEYLEDKAILFLIRRYNISEEEASGRLDIKDIILI